MYVLTTRRREVKVPRYVGTSNRIVNTEHTKGQPVSDKQKSLNKSQVLLTSNP